MVFLYKTKCFCFFVSFSIISACRNKRKNFRSMRKCRIFFAERTLKNLSLVNFMNYTIRSNVYNLSYCWSFSTYLTVFVSSFLSLSYLHSRKRENCSDIWKNVKYFCRTDFEKSGLLILWTTQENQTCIIWVIVGLSIRNKLSFFLFPSLSYVQWGMGGNVDKN